MKKTTLSLLIAGLFASPAVALAQAGFTGSVSVTGIGSSVDSDNRFRFEEYRDLSDGITAGTDLRRNDPGGRMRLFSENLGRDDQFVELSGNRYGFLKYSLYNNNIVHNWTFGAITPFTGIGTKDLTFAGALGATPSTNTAGWNRFDYGIQHKNYGGVGEVKPWADSPFYFRAAANYKETQGIKPIGNALTSPGGPTLELPVPVDYATTDVSAEAGYATKALHYSVALSWTKFEDKNDFYTWRNPAIVGGASTTTTETTTIAADNQTWKIAGNAVWKQLPMASSLALRGTYQVTTNDIPVATGVTAVSGGVGTVRATNPSDSTYHGEIVYTTLSASWTPQLARALDARLYYNYNKKDNKSNQIVFTPTGGSTCDLNPITGASLTTCTTELFHYEKNNLGVDAQYRMSPQNKFSGGLDWTETKRERIDFEKSTEDKVYVEWKNASFEDVTTRIKYQFMQRSSEFGYANLDPALSNNNLFNYYLKRFDLNDVDQDLVKAVLDWTPVRFLDLGAEGIFKQNRYKDVALGRNRDTRKEIYLSAAYGDPQRWRVSTFFDFETTSYDSTHYQGTPNAATFPAAVSATVFEWKGNVKDENWVVGIAADWLPISRLKLRSSLIYQDTEGTVDFSANHPGAVIVNIPAYDSFTRTLFDVRGTYAMTRNFEFTLGAAYERFRYDDAQMNGYNYTQLTGANQNFLSGAYAFPNYTAKVLYATLKYNL